MMNVVEKVAILNLHDSLIFKNKLIHSLSHEIRTPINYILGANQRIKSKFIEYLEPLQQQLFIEEVDSVVSTSKKLSLIVQNIVDHSMLLSSNFILLAKKFKVRDLMKELAFIYATKAKLKNVILDVSEVEDIEWVSD